MSTSTTTNLGLILDNADEPVKTHHRHANENLATLDVTIKSLQDAMDNAKALLGQLGIDADDHYAVDAETARTTLGVPSLSDIGDIVRQNIPLMSPTTLGGAKLEEHGGLVLRDEKLGIGSLVHESDGAVRGGIVGLTAKGHAEQDGTPTPDSPVEIQVVRGRNLAEYNGVNNVVIAHCTAGTTYTFSLKAPPNSVGVNLKNGDNSGPIIVFADPYTQPLTFTPSSDCDLFLNGYTKTSIPFVDAASDIQLERDSVAHGYVPYGDYVGLEVRDTNDQLLSTIPIPLPSRGWVGSLPDGTADVLTLDGAGKVTWEENTDDVVLDGSMYKNVYSMFADIGNYCLSGAVDNVIKPNVNNATIPPILASYLTATFPNNLWNNTSVLSISSTNARETQRLRFRIPIEENTVESANAYLAAHPLTVLYPLATPIIEECGYVNMPSIEGDCTISIPELDALGVKYFVDDSAGTLAKQWYERAQSEYADRITTLEQAVAELATS